MANPLKIFDWVVLFQYKKIRENSKAL